MQRRSIRPRDNWQSIVESQGLIWHTDGTTPYWDESAYYAFSLEEIERLESASEEVFDRFLELGDRICDDFAMLKWLGIPEYCHDAIATSWRDKAPSLEYGRFDFGYDGSGDPKLFEFNCDTPTSMLETGVVQWQWKEDCFPHLDQFTSLHDKLIARWKKIAKGFGGRRVWFTHIADPSYEDVITTTYMRDLASQAGLETHAVVIDDIGLDAQGRIVDHENQLITGIFKLYPWEWIVNEAYGPDIVRHLPTTAWVEPIWKMMWSNKGVLQLLCDMFPGHPNLLPASTDREGIGPSYVAKPFLAREGSNIELVQDGHSVARTEGSYGGGSIIYQQAYPLKDFGSGFPVIGCWVVGGEAAGMGIREDGRITGNTARFIPHVIED